MPRESSFVLAVVMIGLSIETVCVNLGLLAERVPVNSPLLYLKSEGDIKSI